MLKIRVQIKVLTRRVKNQAGAEKIDTIVKILSLESLLRDKKRIEGFKC